MICYVCDKNADVTLTSHHGLCRLHFDERCRGVHNKPSMSVRFGPSELHIVYDPDKGLVVPDNKIRKEAKRIVSHFISFKGDVTHTVGSMAYVDEYRKLISEGLIEPWHIRFLQIGVDTHE